MDQNEGLLSPRSRFDSWWGDNIRPREKKCRGHFFGGSPPKAGRNSLWGHKALRIKNVLACARGAGGGGGFPCYSKLPISTHVYNN